MVVDLELAIDAHVLEDAMSGIDFTTTITTSSTETALFHDYD